MKDPPPYLSLEEIGFHFIDEAMLQHDISPERAVMYLIEKHLSRDDCKRLFREQFPESQDT